MAGLSSGPWIGVFVTGVLVTGLLVWVWLVLPSEPAPRVRNDLRSLPNQDLVSVTVRALAEDRLGPLLAAAQQRLNTWSVETTGRTLAQLPTWVERLRRRALPGTVRVRRNLRTLRSLQRRARWAGTRWLPRWDPWRSPARSRAVLREAVARWLEVFTQQVEGGNPNA